MPHSTAHSPGPDAQAATVVDHQPHHYGTVVRDIFNDAGWTPAEPVRARDWHDCGAGHCVQSETAFD